MADERKSSNWWQTLPGFLTAGAAFLAAMTGLITGLNQTGLIDRAKGQPTQQPIIERTGATSSASKAPQPEAQPEREPSPDAGSTAAQPTRARPARATAARPDTTPAAAPAPARAQPQAGTAPPDSESGPAAPGGRLPSGAVLELAAASRVCSTTHEEGDEFAATLVVPATGENGLVLPIGTAAVLEVRHLPAPTFLGARLESVAQDGKRYSVTRSEARIQRELAAGAGATGLNIGACIPAGGRITVTLKAPLTIGPS